MLALKRLYFFCILFSCSCSQQKKVVQDIPDALLWKTKHQVNIGKNTPTTVDLCANIQMNEIEKTTPISFKSHLLTTVISRKLKKLHKHLVNDAPIYQQAKKQSLNTAKRDFSWLWSTLILLGVLAITLLIVPLVGVVPAIISLFLMMLLLYLVLLEELGAVIGQAAIIIAINALMQVLFSVLL